MVCVHQEPCTSRDTLQCPGHRSLGGSPGGGVCLSLYQVLPFRAGREKERAPNFPRPQSMPSYTGPSAQQHGGGGSTGLSAARGQDYLTTCQVPAA